MQQNRPTLAALPCSVNRGLSRVYSARSMDARLTIHARLSRLLAPTVGAFVLLEAVFLVFTRVGPVLSLLAFALLSLALAAGLGLEVAVWHWKGARTIEVEQEQLTIRRGPGGVPRAVPRKSVRSVAAWMRMGRRTVVIVLVTGEKLRLRGDAFPEDRFRDLCRALLEWR